MPVKHEPPEEPKKTPSDLFSGEEILAMLEEFRERVREGVLNVTPENQVIRSSASDKGPEGAGSSDTPVRELEPPPEARIERPREPRVEVEPPKQVVGLVRQAVVERLAARILENWEQSARGPSLRQEVVDQLVESVLERWTRELG